MEAAELAQVTDDGGLDKGGSTGVGSKGTVFADRAGMKARELSGRPQGFWPKQVAEWSFHQLKWASLQVEQVRGRGKIRGAVLDKRNPGYSLDIQVKLSSR